MRTRKMGKSQEIRVQHVLREIRRHIHTHGRAPSIDAESTGLRLAWVKLIKALEHDSKVRRVAA